MRQEDPTAHADVERPAFRESADTDWTARPGERLQDLQQARSELSKMNRALERTQAELREANERLRETDRQRVAAVSASAASRESAQRT